MTIRSISTPALTLLFCVALVTNGPAQQQSQQQQPQQQQQQRRQADSQTQQHPNPPKEAVAVIQSTEGHEARGVITLKQTGETVHITGRIEGLTPGKHGFHIHEFGDLRAADGTSAGGHYSPQDHQHGGPDAQEHHAGDLGNIEANDQGIAEVDKQSRDFAVHFVVGRAMVVHAGEDDMTSQPSGNAGARVGVGVIGFAQVQQDDSSAHSSTNTQSSTERTSSSPNTSGEEQPFEEQLWSYLKRVEYAENYSSWPGKGDEFYPGESPHGAHLKLYVNRRVTNNLTTPPDKSIIVKENYTPNKELDAITIMYRINDYDPEHQNWYWIAYKPDGNVAMMNDQKVMGKVQSCIECHKSAKGDDYIFSNDE